MKGEEDVDDSDGANKTGIYRELCGQFFLFFFISLLSINMSSIHALSSIAPSDRLELARLPAESSTAPSAPPSEIQLPSQLTTFEPNANTVYLHVERPPNKHRLLTPRITAPLKVYALSETGDSLTKETRGSRAVSKLCEMTEFHTDRVKLLKEWD